jgi:hypothetical protein
MSKKRTPPPYADPQQSKAFKQLFDEEAPEDILLHLLNSFMSLENPLTAIEDRGGLFSEGYYRCMGCLSDAILVKAIDAQNRTILIHFTMLHLHRGITDVEIVATERIQNTLDDWKEPYPLHCYFLALTDFDVAGWESTQSIQLGKSRTKNLHCGIFWVNLQSCLPDPSKEASNYTDQQQWAYFFLNTAKTIEIPAYINAACVLKAFQVLELASWSKLDLKWYNNPETTLAFRIDRALKSYQSKDFALNEQYLTQSAPGATLSLGLLKKELGYYPVNAIAAKDLNITAVEGKQAAVFPLFRYWAEQAKAATGMDITIVNEQNLLDDYEKEMRTALLSLFQSDEMASQRNSKNWEIHVFIGLLEARLDIQWHFEYILKQKPLYKKMQALRSILAYLAANETANIAMDDIYKSLLTATVNIDNISGDIALEKSGKLIKMETGLYSHVPENLQNVVRNLMGDMIKKLSEKTKNTPRWLSKGENTHDKSVFEQLIEQNRVLFFGE